MASIKIENDAHWRALRRKHIGASESPALFNMLPWVTPWKLWMQKAGKLQEDDLDDVSHIKQGKYFEGPVAAWAQEKYGITLNKVHRFLIDDQCKGMSASLDFEQVGTGTRIPTEIKWVLRKGDVWEYDGDVITQAPDYYLIQVQHQLACAGASYGQLLAFIDGDVRRAVYERREPMIAVLRDRIAQFWADIAADKEPEINFKADAEAVMRYAAAMPVRSVDWTPEMERLAKRAHWMAGFAKRADEQADAAKAELAHIMLEAAKRQGANDEDGKVVCEGGGFRISNYSVAPYPGKTITADMVGETIGERCGFRVCKVSRPKPKKGKKETSNA